MGTTCSQEAFDITEAVNFFNISQKLVDEHAVHIDALKKDVSGWKAKLQSDRIIFDQLKTEMRNVEAKFVDAQSLAVNGSLSLVPLVPPLVMPSRTISDCIEQLK